MAVSAQFSCADSIHTFYITQATMFMGPNDGSGDNVYFTLTGPGVNVTGVGGMACFDWCSGPISAPVGNPTQIFLDEFLIAIFNGRSYDPSTLELNFLFSGDGGLNGKTAGIVGSDNVLQFNLISPTTGSWALNFAPTTDANGNPAFIFTDGRFSASAQAPTPEPGTIVLMLTGLAAIAGNAKRKRKFQR